MIIGGGRSSCELIDNFARAFIEPTVFNALQITTNPLSERLTWLIVNTDSPSIDDDALRFPIDIPGNIIERFPSIDQKIVGRGLPDLKEKLNKNKILLINLHSIKLNTNSNEIFFFVAIDIVPIKNTDSTDFFICALKKRVFSTLINLQ